MLTPRAAAASNSRAPVPGRSPVEIRYPFMSLPHAADQTVDAHRPCLVKPGRRNRANRSIAGTGASRLKAHPRTQQRRLASRLDGRLGLGHLALRRGEQDATDEGKLRHTRYHPQTDGA
jgi:hypothetical protein